MKKFYINNDLLLNLYNKKYILNKNEIVTKSRNVVITPELAGINFHVYNGKIYSIIKITDYMVGHKLGEFSHTRKKFIYKKKKNFFYGTKK